MKLKNLKKKIRRLEKRLREGPKKLAKLRRNLQAMEAPKEATVRPGEATTSGKKSAKAREKEPRVSAKTQAKPVDRKGQSASKKVKRKLNLSPERRAQLAAAMNARWAAKRAAAAANPPSGATVWVAETVQSSENRHGGI